MNKATLSAICVTIILACLGSGCVEPIEENYYYYSIMIVARQPFNYTVYAPIALEYGSNYSMEEIVSHMQIVQGAGRFDIAWTEYGSALKIESNDTIYLFSEYQNTDDYHPLYLSMIYKEVDNETIEHWIICEAAEPGELEVSITLRASAGECCGEVRTERTEPEFQTISCDDWQKVTTFYSVVG